MAEKVTIIDLGRCRAHFYSSQLCESGYPFSNPLGGADIHITCLSHFGMLG